MKSKETTGKFVRLKSKMYSLIDVNGGENKKEKGVNKNIFKKIRHKEFVDNNNKLHRIGIYHVCKISLPCFDDNR